MKTYRTTIILTGLMSALLVGGFRLKTEAHSEEAAPEPRPVEADMHEFMEYAFEPSYKRLRESFAAVPADRAAWKAVKGDALTLAEAANLLLFRGPQEERGSWDETAVLVRESGGALYRAAKQSDLEAARGHYKAMLKNCNQCHTEFAEGKYQLEP